MAKKIILLLIIIGGLWYFIGRNRGASDEPEAQSGPTAPAQTQTAPAPQPSAPAAPSSEATGTGSPTSALEAGTAVVHYFTKVALAECLTDTVTLTQEIDSRYGHPASGALVAMTLSLPQDAPENYDSALAPGTRLITMRLDKDGVAYVDYNRKLNEDLGQCRAAQRRAQIVSTLKEFAQIKNVVITIGGQVWQ